MPGKLTQCKPVRRITMSVAWAAGGLAGFLAGQYAAAEQAARMSLLPLMKSGRTVVGEQIRYPAEQPSEVTAVIVTLAPGAETGWHTHDVPTFGYVLEGELRVAYRDGSVRHFRAGDAILEAMSVAHNGRNTGDGPMRILAISIGASGIPTSRPCAAC